MASSPASCCGYTSRFLHSEVQNVSPWTAHAIQAVSVLALLIASYICIACFIYQSLTAHTFCFFGVGEPYGTTLEVRDNEFVTVIARVLCDL